MDDLSEVPNCDCTHKDDCTAIKKSKELEQRQRLMHFLIRLNDAYESIRGQILLMDPLPNVSRAYCMIARVETQRQVTGNQSNAYREVAAMVNRPSSLSHGEGELSSNALAVKSGQNPRNKRDNRRAKNARYCDHCQRNGHTQDQCFKIIGYPDWYEGPREAGKGKKISRVAANVTSQTEQLPDSPLNDNEVPKTLGQTDHTLVQALAQEMMKLMKMKGNAEHQHSFAHFAGMAGSNSYSNISCTV